MKKTLLLFCALLMLGVSGVWAAAPNVSGKTFTLQCKRGYIYYNGTNLLGTNTAADASEFAIISNAGQTYLYDVTNNAFVCHTTAATAGTTGNPALESNSDLSKIATGFSFGETGIDAYPYYLEETTFGNWVNMDGTPKVYLNTWKNFESGNGGNTYKINIVDDDFDQSEVINAFWNRWNITSSDLTANLWAAMGAGAPAGVTALGSYTPFSRSQDITISSDGEALEILFKYISGSHRLETLGVDLLDGEDNVIASDYHFGYTGTGTSNNTYLLTGLSAGSYKLRYIINGSGISSSVGQISLLKLAGSYTNISQWYVIRMHSNYQSNYMYYDSGKATGISFTGISTSDLSAVNNDNYLWGFVYSGGGIQLYNKSAGDSKALDYATPSTLSAAGTSVSLKFETGSMGSYGAAADGTFAIYDASATKYLNFQGGDLKRWGSSDTGSTFMIDAVNPPTTLSYTVKDANGASYSDSYSGIAGVTNPAFTGCYGYSLSNQSWRGTSYNANIAFPFSISSNGVTNYTYIGNYGSQSFCWYVKSADATDFIVKKDNLPTNQDGEVEKWKWSIIPSFSSGAFTFQLKNAATGKYVTTTSTGTNHNASTVTLTGAGTNFTYIHDGSYNRWCLPTTKDNDGVTKLELSVNSSSAAGEQEIGTYTVHNGTAIAFFTPDNFSTLTTNLATAKTYTASIIGPGLGEYATTSAYTTAITEATPVIDGDEYATAAQITSWTNTILSSLVLNIPEAPCFLRIKTRHGTYLSNTATSYSGYTSCLAHIAEANNSTLFYFDGTTLVDYAEGLKMNGCNVGSVGGAGKSFVFAESTEEPLAGKYSLKFNDESDKFVYSWGSPYFFSQGLTSEGPNTVMTLEAVESLPVTITAANYATLYSPVALTIPSGVTAYTATIDGTKLVLTPVSTTIPKNTGVLLYSATPGTYDFDIADDVAAIAENAFAGTVATINRSKTGEVYNSYILSGGSAGVCFYHDGPATLKGFKAFVDATPASVKGFLTFDFGDTTAIDELVNSTSENRTIYNLAGQRVSKLQRGVNIVNGKKVLVK